MKLFGHKGVEGLRRVLVALVCVSLLFDLARPCVQAIALNMNEQDSATEGVETGDRSADETGSEEGGVSVNADDAANTDDSADEKDEADKKGSDADAKADDAHAQAEPQDGEPKGETEEKPEEEPERDAEQADAPRTLRYESDWAKVDVRINVSTLYDKEGNAVPASDIRLEVTNGDMGPFSEYAKDASSLKVVDIGLYARGNERLNEVNQQDGAMDVSVSMSLAEVDEQCVVREVRVYRLVKDESTGNQRVELVPETDWSRDGRDVMITAHSVGLFAVCCVIEQPVDSAEGIEATGRVDDEVPSQEVAEASASADLDSTVSADLEASESADSESAEPEATDAMVAEEAHDDEPATDDSLAGSDSDVQAPAEPLGHSVDFTYENKAILVEAKTTDDSVFATDDVKLNASGVHLVGDASTGQRFAELTNGYEGEFCAVELAFCDEQENEAQQIEGSTALKLTIPAEDDNAGIQDVEVFSYNESPIDGKEGHVAKVDDVVVDERDRTIEFIVDELGSYAVRYTVDYYYDDQEYHMAGGSTMLLSELFEQLGIKRDSADVESIRFTKPFLLQFTRHDDGQDWTIRSILPFNTTETMTLTFSDGYELKIAVLDDRTYSESSDLSQFMTNWEIKVGGVKFSNETVDDDTVIEYTPNTPYSLVLNFAERPELGFATPETDPPVMSYQLPDCFVVPDDYMVSLNVDLGRKGVLPYNTITIARRTGEDGKEHRYLNLRWNWEDTLHWAAFRDSAQAKLKITINGTFEDTSPNVLSINGKDVAVRRQDLHNAIVNKEGTFNRDTGVISYTVTVSSDGTTNDITLTDTLGSALVYQGDIEYDASASTNRSETQPQITARTGNTFSVLIPAMVHGDKLVFRYTARVDYDSIAVSGSPMFEETGNTAQIFGDSYTLDNTAQYHETNIEFSDLEKNVVNKRRETIDGKYCYILSWEIETNKRAQYPLADTTITDTIGTYIQPFSKYYGDGLTIKCYSNSGSLEDTRHVSWEDLGVDLADDITWTYHIPDTDPQYRYVLTYDTIVDMSAQTETVVAENTAEGKGGIDSDRAVLTLPGVAGISVSKKATDLGSTTVTWEITMTVSGASLNSQRLVLAEHSGSKTSNGQTTWYSDYMPGKWFDVTSGDNRYYGWYKETLQKVEVIGLEGDETYTVTYGYRDSNKVLHTEDFIFDAPGESVMERDFNSAANKWQADYFRLEFYKDYERTQGGLTNPGGENPSRTLTIRLTNTFPDEWATAARASMLSTNKMDSSAFAHVNWIDVQTPDNDGVLKTRAFDTDKIEPMPPNLYKTAIEYTDTTLASASQMTKWPLNFPDVIYNKNYNSLSYSEAEHGDLPVFPAFRYQILVTGIKYDEPLVIEDTFDTSKFALLTMDNLGGAGGGIITCKSKNYTQNLVMRVAGTRYFGAFATGNNNFYRLDPNGVTYSFGIRNKGYTDLAEDYGCELELTDTGFRVTINNLFRDLDGNLFPNYGVEYYLVPKNLEALREIEEIARTNGRVGLEPKASFTNTATCRGLTASATVKYGITNDFMPLDKTSETYMEMMNGTSQKLEDAIVNGQTVRDTPEGIDPEDVKRYVMRYRVVLNKSKERLNQGNDIVAEDEYSANLSVEFPTINITTDPPAAASKVSYDFSDNVGYFTIPDETKVVIEYDAVVLNTTAGVVGVSNEVRMLQYKKTLDDNVEHGGAGGSSALNPSILVKKYGSGHMEKGLNGAQFQLYTYNHQSYTRGDSNTSADWTPVTLTLPQTHDAVFTTQYVEGYGDGYAEIELSQNDDGMTLEKGKVYGLREIKTPVGIATNGDTINYQNPHAADFFCYVFTICADNETADYSNFKYLPDDTMTVRNNPESIALHLKKELSGNCTLSDAEKNKLTYQLFRKRQFGDDQNNIVYAPIMKTEADPENPDQEIDVVDSRFVGISYNDIAQQTGVDITGLTVESGTSVGEYLLVEYGNDTIMDGHPDWNWRGTYAWSDGTEGSFTNSSYTAYDKDGANPQTVRGVAFTVTSQEIKDGEDKTVTLTNTYDKAVVNLTANKRWTGPLGSAISWPSGKEVEFQLGTLNDSGAFEPVSGVAKITLNNVKDANGEDAAGSAVFKNLPKYVVVQGAKQQIAYAVREVSAVSGYDIVYPVTGNEYAAFGDGTSVTIKNQVRSTSIAVSKVWDKDAVPSGATATFRLYSYTGSDASTASWVTNVNDIDLDGSVDAGNDTFGERAEWRADFTGLPMYDGNGEELHYVVKELSCTPVGYEPVEEYATNGKAITNKPASTTFTVTKRWSGTPGDAWPEGEQITLRLARKTRSGDVDGSFSVTYVLSAGGIVSQDSIDDPYGEAVQAGTFSNGTLSVANLPKYDSDGNEWRYYVTETAIQSISDESDVSGDYTKTYRDRNNYTVQTDYTYSGGSVTNTRSTKELTISKTVAGNMGDITEGFRFTVTLKTSDDTPYSGVVACTKANVDDTLTFSNGSAVITLKHGETITLRNLPGSLRYTIAENDSDAKGYETTYVVNDGTVVSGRSAMGTLNSNPTVAFTNTRAVIIPTGVESAPMIFVVALTIIAGIVLCLRRRVMRVH